MLFQAQIYFNPSHLPTQQVASLNVVMKEAVNDAVNRTTEKYEGDRAQLTGDRQ